MRSSIGGWVENSAPQPPPPPEMPEAFSDAGTLEATTIVDLTGPEPVLLREGRGDPAAFGL